MLLEYRIPALPALVATFDYQFSSCRPANDANTEEAAGYQLFDVGGRYLSKFGEFPVTWRLNVNNVTDRKYWSTIAPSNLTGTNTGNLLAHFGSPRTVWASMTVNF